MDSSPATQDARLLRHSLPPLPEPVARPVLVLVSGLPGTGKSYFARKLAERFPFAILETDVLRKVLVQEPAFTAEESTRLFDACHLLVANLLSQGIPVVLDATNLVEHHREYIYSIAERLGAKLIIVQVEAPAELVHQRMDGRALGADPGDHSTAGWGVYRKMRPSAQPIRRNHYVLDTSRDILPVVEKVLREVKRWIRA